MLIERTSLNSLQEREKVQDVELFVLKLLL